MKLFSLVVLVFGITMNANAEPVKIETDSFLIELPSTWKVEELSSQAKLLGPNNEFLIISSYRITGEGSEADLQSIRNEFGENIASTMVQSSSEPDLKITLPLIKKVTPAGFPVWEINSETIDNLQFYNLYGTVGLRVALLITLEGEIKNKASASEVLSAINNIKWY